MGVQTVQVPVTVEKNRRKFGSVAKRCYSRETIRQTVMSYIRFPSPLKNVEDLLHEPGIGVRYETD